jgi:molybdopterin-guanine dinucleotide biosynthesis protein A
MHRLGVVLAGGASSRFGSDKVAAILDAKSLLSHVCERASPQVDRLIINRNTKPLPELSGQYEFMADDWPGEGPLAGIITALEFAGSRGFSQVASFPCDTPIFPANLVSRLGDRLAAANADCCMARHGEREQRALALWNVACAPVLKVRFLSGMRRLGDVPRAINTTIADFADSFVNINTPDDLDNAARQFGSKASH